MSVLPALLGWLVAANLLGAGNTVGYHRLFTHRAFVAKPAVRVALALLGALHSGPPLFWIGLHRLHHLRSETPEDPHSPRNGGFWQAHTGWILAGPAGGRVAPAWCVLFALSGFGQQARTLVFDLGRLRGTVPPSWAPLVKDLADDPVLALLDRPLVTTGLFLAQGGLAWAIGGGWGLLWLWSLHLLLTNASWSVNSVCHTPGLGRAPFDTGDDSRDVPWLAWATGGESYHNSHHRYPRSACHGLGGGWDPSWALIRGLCALGLARDPWLPRQASSR